MRIMNLGSCCSTLFLSALVFLFSACGGGGDTGSGGNGGNGGGGTPSFSISLAPPSLTVQRGASGTMLATIVPQNGFNAAVTFTQSGLPAGVAATATPGASAMTYVLQFTPDGTVQGGSYPFTLTGKSSGVADATTSGTLVVNASTQPSFSISLAPPSLTVQRGASGTMLATIVPQNGFNAAVTFNQSGLPSGVAGTATPGASAMTYVLQFTPDGTVQGGSYPFTLTGSSPGVAAATASGTLVVTVPTQPSFSLSVSPASLSVPKGVSGNATITITPQAGFSGSVALSASGQPTGVSVAFTPASATTTSIATFAVGASVVAGTYPITLTGTASGAPNASTILNLTVSQPSGGTQIHMSPCLQEHNVIFFAVQDGAGPWTPITGSGGTYTFSLVSGRGAVAITLQDQVKTDEIYTMVIMGSTSELGLQMQDPCPGFQPVSGTYSGAGSGNTVSVALGIAGITNVSAPASGNGAWSIPAVMKKNLGDLFAAESIPGATTQKCILRRDIPLSGSNPSVGGDLNFGAPEAFAPDFASISLSGLSGSYPMITAICHLWTPGLDVGVVGSSFSFAGGSLPAIAVVPASKLRAGDLQGISAVATPMDYMLDPTTPMLLSQYWMATPGSVTLNFQAPSAPPTVTLFQSQPHPRLRVASSFAAPYTSALIFNAVQVQGSGPSSSSRGCQILMSPGWISSGGSFPLDTPDFNSLAGWNASWDLWPSVKILWTTTNSGSTSPASGRVDGGRQWTCSYAAEVTP